MAAVGPTVGGRALLVGTFDGIPGQFQTIQDAVNAAQPGDFILVAPGDYHEQADHLSPPSASDVSLGFYGGVEVRTDNIHLRGMNRSSVVVDGTKPGAPQCSSNAADQDLGPTNSGGVPLGRNGINVVANGVTVDNLTACNFQLSVDTQGNQAGNGGNEIWWNGGSDTGKIGLRGYAGSYLTATDTFDGDVTGGSAFGSYGIFSSAAQGPGVWNQTYMNNFTDSGMYIGACQQVCDAWVNNATMENSALGYSGTNSGGHLTIQNSEFNNNKSGFVSNSQNNDDAPSPQDGSCPNEGETGPTGTHNCWLFTKNSVHDNNNPNVPTTGVAGAGPVGSGVVLSGDHNNIVSGNTLYNNGAWGILLVPYPAVEEEPPPDLKEDNCLGGTKVVIEGKTVCYYDDFGNEVTNNTLKNNGLFGNPSNVDLAELSNLNNPGNCWHGNVDTSGTVTSEPQFIQSPPHSECGIPDSGEPLASSLGAQVACDTKFFASCPEGVPANYPQRTKVVLQPLPPQTTMPEPCLGVPRNSWCPTNPPARKTPPYPVPGAPAE
jgi:hypothetical protein